MPPALSDHTLALAMAAFKAVNNIAIIDLKMVQVCVCGRGKGGGGRYLFRPKGLSVHSSTSHRLSSEQKGFHWNFVML